MPTINLGRVGFVQKGAYSGATAYKVNDVVTYNNITYGCIQAGTGILPTNTSYWKVMIDGTQAVQKTGDETIAGIKTFTSSPIVPTPTNGDNSTKVATTAFVNSEISGDVGIANSPLVKTALNASGTAPIYACRAWVNFNGTGTVAIRASGNISSITDNGVGDYTVNFITAMSDVNYSVLWGNDTDVDLTSNFSIAGAAPRQLGLISSEKTVSLVRIYAGANNPSGSAAKIDFREINIAIFR